METSKNDYTGGYSFFGWIAHSKGKWIYFASSIILILTGIYLQTNYAMQKSLDPIFQTYAGYIAIIIGIFIMFLTIRMYKRLKKGISD